MSSESMAALNMRRWAPGPAQISMPPPPPRWTPSPSQISRLEDRLAHLSSLDRSLQEESASAARERARLQTEWADLAVNLQE